METGGSPRAEYPLSGSDLPLDTPVEIATLEDVLFNYRRNDVAFVLGDKIIILLEHQSTISENMPLRLLIYTALGYILTCAFTEAREIRRMSAYFVT